MNTLLQNGSVSDLTGASAKIARAALLAFIAMTASACAVRHDSLSPRVASAKHIRGNTISYHGQILHDSSQGPNPAAKLGWPLPYAEVTSLYGPRGWDFHDGVDLAAPDGTPVLAAHNGRVIYADNELSSYGKTVIIQGYDRLVTIYAHNSSLLVKPGQEVLQGQQIAEVGSTGKASGPHLHFEVRLWVRDGNLASADPLPVLANSSRKPRWRVSEGLAPILAKLTN